MVKIGRCVLAKEGDHNRYDEREPVRIQAVYFKNLEVVKILLEHGVDPLRQDPSADGLSAFEMASLHHQAAILEAMFDTLQIRINDVPAKPLLHLALLSFDGLISFLVNGVAFKLNLVKTLDLLIGRRAIPGLVDSRIPEFNAESTALFNAVLSNSQLSVELALSERLLTDRGFLDTRCGAELLTPLHKAVQQGSLVMVEKLIDAGCDPTVPAGSGYLTSTLHMCADMESSSAHQLEVLDRILPFFDNVDRSNEDGETPFALAVRLLKFDLALA